MFVDTPLEECERRDPKGLYARARAGKIQGSPASTRRTRRRANRTSSCAVERSLDELVEALVEELGRGASSATGASVWAASAGDRAQAPAFADTC